MVALSAGVLYTVRAVVGRLVVLGYEAVVSLYPVVAGDEVVTGYPGVVLGTVRAAVVG